MFILWQNQLSKQCPDTLEYVEYINYTCMRCKKWTVAQLIYLFGIC